MNTVKIPPYDLKQAVTPRRMLGLWRLMTGFRSVYVGATLSQGVAALAKTGSYLLLRYFADRVLEPGDSLNFLIWIALGFVALALVEGSFSFSAGRLAARTAEGVALRLRNYLYDHIQRLTFTYHAQSQTGDLVQRSTSDVDAVRRFFADQAIGVGRIILLFTINFIALLNLNPTLAWISIVVIPAVVASSIFFFKRISKAYEAFQEQEATLSTTLQENLTGVRVVKAFARQEYERNKFDRDNWEKFNRGIKLMRMHALFWPVTDILCAGQLLFGYFMAATMAIRGDITPGTYLAYVGMVTWLIWPMRNLGRLIVQTSSGLVSFGRVLEILKQDREPLDQGSSLPAGDLKGDITFDSVCFSYADAPDISVLKDITFHCHPGEAVALLGSTGSGKTTLVNLLPRFYDYTEGSIQIDGYELKEIPRRYLRSQIGIVEQEPFLFSRSIRDNITFGVGREVSDEEVFEAAKAAAVHEVILGFPNGYHTLVGEKGVTLSGGQKQRVAIARTLLKNPRILILDDSTSSVDLETEADIREALENLMHNRTTFIIAHRIQSVMNADQILVLEHGKVIQHGTHDSLIESDGIYRKIFQIQTRIEEELEKEVSAA